MFRPTLLLRLAFLALTGLAPTVPVRADCHPLTVSPERIPQAARETLTFVRRHDEAPPGQVGGRRFGNYGSHGESKLPAFDPGGRRITYQEWDIHPKVPGRGRGPERLITGSDGRAWYTADHYCTFTQLR